WICGAGVMAGGGGGSSSFGCSLGSSFGGSTLGRSGGGGAVRGVGGGGAITVRGGSTFGEGGGEGGAGGRGGGRAAPPSDSFLAFAGFGSFCVSAVRGSISGVMWRVCTGSGGWPVSLGRRISVMISAA